MKPKSNARSEPAGRRAPDPIARLRWHHELGREAIAAFPEGSFRDPGTIAHLAAREGVSRDIVWKAVAFARKYTPRQLDELCELRNPDGRPLTFGHVRRLLAVEDRRRRAALQRRAAREGWSHEVLAAEVIGPEGPRSRGGRRPSRPSTPRAALRQIATHSAAWSRRCERCWSGDLVGDATGETAEIEALLDRTIEAVGVFLEAARGLEARLKKARTRLRRRRAAGSVDRAPGGQTRT